MDADGMKQLTHRQYDSLESAITHGRRISIHRRGTEYVGVPKKLWTEGNREAVAILHPTTGEEITVFLDEIDRLEVVPT
jgi:transcriptional regulator